MDIGTFRFAFGAVAGMTLVISVAFALYWQLLGKKQREAVLLKPSCKTK